MTAPINDLNNKLSQLEITTNNVVLAPTPTHNFWSLVKKTLSENPNIGSVSIPGHGTFSRAVLQFFLQNNISCEVRKISVAMKKIEELNLLNKESPLLSQAHAVAITDSDRAVAVKDLEAVDLYERTPLQICALLSHTIAAQNLVRRGANPQRCTRFHGSAITIAAQRNSQELLKIFCAQTALTVCTLFSDYQRTIIQKGFVTTTYQICQIATALFAIDNEALLEIACSWKPQFYNLLKDYYTFESNWRIAFDSFDVNRSVPCGAHGRIIAPAITYQNELQSLTFQPIAGGFAPYVLHKMKEETTAFLRCANCTKMPNLQIVHELKDALELASDQPKKQCSEFMKRWKAQLPTFISVEFNNPRHVVMVMLFKHHCIICNRGYESRKSVEVFRFDTESLTEELLFPLFTVFSSPKDYKDYLFTKLFQKLKMEQTSMECTLESVLELPRQTIENCAWISPVTCVYTYFLLSVFDKKELLVDSVFTEETAHRHKIDAVCLFKNWLYDQKLTYLSQYLADLYRKDQHFFANYVPLNEFKKGYTEITEYCLLYPEIKQKALELKAMYDCLV